MVYVDVELINSMAKLLGSLVALGGALIALYKFYERDKRQSKTIKAIQSEQTLLCYGIKACLQGLAEQGCNGPVHEALDKLDKHEAHFRCGRGHLLRDFGGGHRAKIAPEHRKAGANFRSGRGKNRW